MAAAVDVLVVGGGSAGAVLASRLSEDPCRRVLLVEAGPDYPDAERLPDELKYCYATGVLSSASVERGNEGWKFSAQHDWRYSCVATPLAQAMPVARGRATGGSSAINGTIWLRGTPEGYDLWARSGNEGWGFHELLPIMRRVERHPEGDEGVHGRDGPVPVRQYPRSEWLRPHAAFHAAARAAGFPDSFDLNEPGSTGVGPLAFNNPGDIRWSTALAYLAAARERENLGVLANTLACRVILDGQCAIGVEVADEHGPRVVEARDVVLSAGAIGSPQLLLLSGIGPASHLRDLDIPVVRDLPGVGHNLQDHPMIQLSWSLEPHCHGGPGDPRGQVMLRYTARGSRDRNDLWIASVVAGETMAMYSGVHAPDSRGELRLASTDPRAHPHIDYGYYTAERDLVRMREAVQTGLALAADDAFSGILRQRLAPLDDEIATDEDFAVWARRRTITANHISCTCKMGPATDRMAVVASDGGVHGVEHLWLADASIMPTISRAPTNLTTIVIGEKIAEAITASR